MLAKDMSAQGKSLEKFYLKLACTIERESIAQLITYMMGIKHGKVVFIWGKPLPIFYQRLWVTVYGKMTLEVLWDRQEA